MQASAFLKALKSIPAEDLLATKGLGQVLVDNFTDFQNSARLEYLIREFELLESQGQVVDITLDSLSNQATNNQGRLAGQVICITGTFDLPRSEIKKRLESLGARVVDSLTSATTTLLAGDKAGSKLAKAEKQNIPIVSQLSDLGISD